ncbi:MAG: SDR family oxidoreductase [Burkholderiaceae bacterium]|nr:SDR family oxidoreductase [Microbacteriaceae bacterium]
MLFDGKIAIVTGASSGIGLATTLALVAEGCRVLAVGRSADALSTLRSQAGANVEVFPADVSDATSGALIVRAALERFGRLDCVLPNAGIYAGGDLVDTPVELIAQVVATNVTGVFTLVRAALPHLVDQGSGDILVTSSVAGHQDIHWEPVYSATKHAVQSFVHSVRRQAAATGVRVGAIAPGVVLNPLWGVVHGSPEEQRQVDAGTGIRSSDVAEAIVFMLSRPRHVVVRDLVLLPSAQEL